MASSAEPIPLGLELSSDEEPTVKKKMQLLKSINVEGLLEMHTYRASVLQLQSLVRNDMISIEEYSRRILKWSDEMVEEKKKPVAETKAQASMEDGDKTKLHYLEAHREITDRTYRAYNDHCRKNRTARQHVTQDEGAWEACIEGFKAGMRVEKFTPFVAATFTLLFGLIPEYKDLTCKARITLWYELFMAELEDRRLGRFNAAMIGSLPAGDRDRWIELLDDLPVPILPDEGDFKYKNEVLLMEAHKHHKTLKGGGGAIPGNDGLLFNKANFPEVARFYKRGSSVLSGGGYNAPVVDSEGRTVGMVDLSAVEAYVVDLHNKIEDLRPQERDFQALFDEMRRNLHAAKSNAGGIRGCLANKSRLGVRRQYTQAYSPTYGRGRNGGRGREGPGTRGRGAHYGGEAPESVDNNAAHQQQYFSPNPKN